MYDMPRCCPVSPNFLAIMIGTQLNSSFARAVKSAVTFEKCPLVDELKLKFRFVKDGLLTK